MTKSAIYISEPDAINVERAFAALAGSYDLISGSPDLYDAPQHSDCTAMMIRSETHVDDTILQTFPKLAHIIRVGTGVDNIDLEFCKRSDIAVYNAAGANADAVSEYVATMTLTALRKTHLVASDDVVEWNRFKFRGRGVSECTIGIVGFGNIGRLIYAKLRAFNCENFYIYDPYVSADALPKYITKVESLDDLLPQCDVITLHVPLIDSTRNLIDTTQLQQMRDNAILINASRGGIVHEEAVSRHADEHAEFTYVADTVDGEPQVNSCLLERRNILVTPHIASLTGASEQSMLDTAVQNFLNKSAMKL